jgi:hypothetical protein
VTITGEGVHFNLNGYTITRDEDLGLNLSAGIFVRGACPAVNDPDCSAIFLAEAPGVRINGMSLHNNTIGISSFSFGSVVGNANGAHIDGNDTTGNLRIGIALSGFGGATAEGAKIMGNDFSDTGGFPGAPAFGALITSDGVSMIGNVANDCANGASYYSGTRLRDRLSAIRSATIRPSTTASSGSTPTHLRRRSALATTCSRATLPSVTGSTTWAR